MTAQVRVLDEPRLPKGKVCGSMEEFTSFARRADEANGVELFGDDELEKDDDGEFKHTSHAEEELLFHNNSEADARVALELNVDVYLEMVG